MLEENLGFSLIHLAEDNKVVRIRLDEDKILLSV
jgi:hypothetical protein